MKGTPKTSTAQKPGHINATNEVLKGHYSNAVKVTINNSEVVIDFAYIYKTEDENNQGELVSRIIMPAPFSEKLVEAISNTIATHKAKQQKAVQK